MGPRPGRFRNGAGPFQACGRAGFFALGSLQPPSLLGQTPPGEPATRLGPRAPVGWRPCWPRRGAAPASRPAAWRGVSQRCGEADGEADGSPEMGI